MWPERAVIPNDIVRYCVSCIAEAYVTRHWYPLILQAPEEAFHWAIIPAVPTPANVQDLSAIGGEDIYTLKGINYIIDYTCEARGLRL